MLLTGVQYFGDQIGLISLILSSCASLWNLVWVSHCHCIRFKLVQEESIQFNQLGLRDNVAQICVFEVIWIPYVDRDFHNFCFFFPKLKTLLM